VGTTGRAAGVVLVHSGEVLGRLPPVDLELPWWPEAHDVVAAVRERDGLEITVLRLLRATPGRVAGGEVTYLAETGTVPTRALDPWPGDPLDEHPLRQVWARPGGPAELLAWADDRFRARGITRTGSAQQMRTWNLSALWRIPTTDGRIWLKAVPGFFAHEGAVIDWIGTPVAPRLVDFAPGRALVGDIVGAVNHEVKDPAALRPMVELLTGLQQRGIDRRAELVALGVPERRLETMVTPIASTVEQWGSGLDPAERRAVYTLVAGLPNRLAALNACGVPDTLVHGDFHPGNVAGAPGRYVILDWGDSFVGPPLIDELAFVERLPPSTRAAARKWFVAAWRAIAPGSDPARAAALLEPVVQLLAAVMYARFCAAIEPDERIYHESDVLRMLRQAATSDASP
jgi:Phosphotransferase enzyme family